MTESLEEELFEDEDLDEGACAAEDLDEDLDLEEDLDLDEGYMDELAEALHVDIHPQKSGWVGMPNSVLEVTTEELLALEQDSEVREERAAIRKAVAELKITNESLTKKNKTMEKTLNDTKNVILRLQDVVGVLKEKLETSSLLNAKLLYQNKALDSASLNERQKRKLVEAVSNANSIEEAKVIFETLQNAVGSTNSAKQPKSLSEAVEKSSSIILSNSRRARLDEGHVEDPAFNRWKFLAGIKKD